MGLAAILYGHAAGLTLAVVAFRRRRLPLAAAAMLALFWLWSQSVFAARAYEVYAWMDFAGASVAFIAGLATGSPWPFVLASAFLAQSGMHLGWWGERLTERQYAIALNILFLAELAATWWGAFRRRPLPARRPRRVVPPPKLEPFRPRILPADSEMARS